MSDDAPWSSTALTCIPHTTGTTRMVDPDTGVCLLRPSVVIPRSNPSAATSDGANRKLRRQRPRSAPHRRPTEDFRSVATVEFAGTVPLASGDPAANRCCYLLKYTGFLSARSTAPRHCFPSTFSIRETHHIFKIPFPFGPYALRSAIGSA